MSRRTILLGLAILCFTPASFLAGAPPQITRFDPLALSPGHTVELRLNGQHLQDARSLWTTFAARCEFLPARDESQQRGESLACRVTVPRDEQVGIGALRVVTGEGVSNPVLIMLDDLSSTAEVADHHAAEQAQPMSWPTAIDGQCDAVQEDWFRFHATAGQRIAFEVVSQRMGSKLDPFVRLMRADKTEILQLDDVEGVAGEVRFAHTFAAEGEYFLALRDVRYGGGTDYRYRLRVGTFPLVRAAYPGGGPSGAVMSFHLLAQEGNDLSPLHVRMPIVAERARLASFGVPGNTASGSAWFQVEAANCSESAEAEPNDGPTEATLAVVPGMLNGRLDKVGDRDCFKFAAKKGQRLRCIARTRELGADGDLFISLQKFDGTHIAQARQDRQTVLDAEVPEDGEYLLIVGDLLIGGPPGHVYRLDVSDAFSGFALHAENSQYTAPQGGTFLVKVLSQRRGYNGPIELNVEGLGDGVTLDGNKFDGAETVLRITLPATVAQGEIRHAVIVGKADVNGQAVAVPINQREQLRGVFPNVWSLPTQLENTIAVGVGPPFPPFFELSLPGTPVYFPRLVGTSTFEIQIQRTNGSFKDPIAVRVDGLPAGVSAEAAPIDDGLKAVRVTLKGPVDLAEGDHAIRIVGTGKFQDQTRTVELHDVTLRVTPPLVVSLSMAGPVVAGRQQDAVVSLRRFGANPQPVQLEFSGGPTGLLAPIATTIPADATEMKVPLGATATASAGAFENLIVVASTMVNGQNVTVRSQPAKVEIQPPPAN